MSDEDWAAAEVQDRPYAQAAYQRAYQRALTSELANCGITLSGRENHTSRSSGEMYDYYRMIVERDSGEEILLGITSPLQNLAVFLPRPGRPGVDPKSKIVVLSKMFRQKGYTLRTVPGGDLSVALSVLEQERPIA